MIRGIYWLQLCPLPAGLFELLVMTLGFVFLSVSLHRTPLYDCVDNCCTGRKEKEIKKHGKQLQLLLVRIGSGSSVQFL